MYIEVLHDATGVIAACHCVDSLPMNDGSPLFTMQGGPPAGLEQSRINIDTLTAMEIDAASGQKAVIDQVTGKAKIIDVSRGEHIIKTYRVDVSQTITPPPGVMLPAGMNIRGFLKK